LIWNDPLPILTDFPLSLRDEKKRMMSVCSEVYENVMTRELRDTHLGGIKDSVKPSPWAYFENRNMDTVLTRLRIGYSRLRASLHKIKLALEPYCENCPGLIEDSTHVIMDCSKYNLQRRYMLRDVMHITGTPLQQITLEILLDGAGFSPHLRKQILRITSKFIKSTGLLHRV
jgi:hypothetical protein